MWCWADFCPWIHYCRRCVQSRFLLTEVLILCPRCHHSKLVLKAAVQSESVGMEFLSCLLEEKMQELLFPFSFNLKGCQAHEGVKNWVEQYDRTSPLTSENWMWPKNPLLEQVCFPELVVLFFWAGRTDLVQAWLSTWRWSQPSFVLWDSSLQHKGSKALFLQLPLPKSKAFVIDDCLLTYLGKQSRLMSFRKKWDRRWCHVGWLVLLGCWGHHRLSKACGKYEMLGRWRQSCASQVRG